jgi:SAM-dependent methyltransferase
VWAIAVLHHLDDAQRLALLHQVARLLKPGGRFAAVDPSDRRLVGMFRRFVRRTYERHHSPDERELDMKALGDQVRSAGLARVEMHPSDFFVSPLAWVVPSLPAPAAAPAMALDTLFLRVPGLRQLSSSFLVVAHKPG